MNANYLYDVFEATETLGLSDLTIGLAHVRVEKPMPDGLTAQDVRKFMAKHYDALVKAYKPHDREAFAEVVNGIVAAEEVKDDV